MNKQIHTSESLKAQDGEFENFHYTLEDGERYLLTDDQCFPKAVMLSDDSALQAIMFYSAFEPIEC